MASMILSKIPDCVIIIRATISWQQMSTRPSSAAKGQKGTEGVVAGGKSRGGGGWRDI
jgi:hypothetical protein